MGYKKSGVAQGGLVDTPDGKWYAMLFQDRDAVGRVPVLVPVRWEDGWPVHGDREGKVPLELEKPGKSDFTSKLIVSDEFYQKDIAAPESAYLETENLLIQRMLNLQSKVNLPKELPDLQA